MTDVERQCCKKSRGAKQRKKSDCEEIEKAVLELAIERAGLGAVRMANELKRRGMTISPTEVRCVWLRHENVKKTTGSFGS